MALTVVDPVFPLAQALLECLCEQLPGTVGGDVCVCCLHPGTVAPMDHCCRCEIDGQDAEGQAWVTVTRIYPTTGRFPVQQLGEVSACNLQRWAADMTMGVYRCAAVPDSRGNPPACDGVTHDLAKVLSDAAAMRDAVHCCFTGDDTPDVAVGEWTPVGPAGGCVGGQMTLTVGFGGCCPPAGPGATRRCC